MYTVGTKKDGIFPLFSSSSYFRPAPIQEHALSFQSNLTQRANTERFTPLPTRVSSTGSVRRRSGFNSPILDRASLILALDSVSSSALSARVLCTIYLLLCSAKGQGPGSLMM